MEARYIDSIVPDATMELFGKKFQTPIMTGALSHTDMVTIAQGAKAADACSYGRHLKNVMQENGADGVAREIGNLTNQLKQVMAMTGCAKLAQIDKSVIHNLN